MKIHHIFTKKIFLSFQGYFGHFFAIFGIFFFKFRKSEETEIYDGHLSGCLKATGSEICFLCYTNLVLKNRKIL